MRLLVGRRETDPGSDPGSPLPAALAPFSSRLPYLLQAVVIRQAPGVSVAVDGDLHGGCLAHGALAHAWCWWCLGGGGEGRGAELLRLPRLSRGQPCEASTGQGAARPGKSEAGEARRGRPGGGARRGRFRGQEPRPPPLPPPRDPAPQPGQPPPPPPPARLPPRDPGDGRGPTGSAHPLRAGPGGSGVGRARVGPSAGRPEATSAQAAEVASRGAEGSAASPHGGSGAGDAAAAQPAGLPAGLQPHDGALLPALRGRPQLPRADPGRGGLPGRLRREAGALQPPPDGRLRAADALPGPAQDRRLRGRRTRPRRPPGARRLLTRLARAVPAGTEPRRAPLRGR